VVDVEPAADEVRIGRRAGAEIQLPFSTVSGLHARVFKHADGWALVDMGSSNGTFTGQTRLASGQPRMLKAGEIFRLADVSVAFEGEVDAPKPEEKSVKTESTATLARRLVNDLFQAVAGAETARVVVEKGPSTGQTLALALPDRAYKVGRAPDCDLVLSDEDVSREHAAFERRWQGVFVRDLGSKNGVELSGKKIRGEQRVHDGEILLMGGSQLRIDDPEERYLRQMEADAREAPKRTAAEGAPVAPVLAQPTAPAKEPAPLPKPAEPAPEKPATVAAKAAPEEKRDSKDNGQDKATAKDKPNNKDKFAAEKSVAKGPAKASVNPRRDEPMKTSRVLPFFVTMFSLAVLGGVGYLVWVIFFAMGSGGRP
jgi:pSer/pThr/pTyr-binding forkhead associated (FHA) protein/nitrate reductase NapE component